MSVPAWSAADSGAGKPRFFSTTETVDVDIDIPAADMEAAGWVYVGSEAGGAAAVEAALIVAAREFHEEEHDGPMRWCAHRICRVIRDATEVPTW